jgi:hypothetical protein
MRGLSLIVAVVGAMGHAAAQTAPPVEMMEHWRRATVSLGRVVSVSGQPSRYDTLGSAVIAAVDEKHGCILTAKHLVSNPRSGWNPTEIRVRLPRNAGAQEGDLGVVAPLIVNGQPVWKSLSDGSDLAVFPAPDLSKYNDLHGVFVGDFGANENDVFQGAPVLVLGYPPVIGETPLFFPIARSGIIAWTDPSDRLGRTFLIDANVFPGNSGSPVFHLRTGLDRFGNFAIGGGLALIGILSGVAEQNIKVVTQPPLGLPTEMNVPLKGVGSIGQIEPASKAKQLVEQHCGAPKQTLVREERS